MVTWNNIRYDNIFPSIACFSMGKKNSSSYIFPREMKRLIVVFEQQVIQVSFDNGLICHNSKITISLFVINVMMAVGNRFMKCHKYKPSNFEENIIRYM